MLINNKNKLRLFESESNNYDYSVNVLLLNFFIFNEEIKKIKRIKDKDNQLVENNFLGDVLGDFGLDETTKTDR